MSKLPKSVLVVLLLCILSGAASSYGESILAMQTQAREATGNLKAICRKVMPQTPPQLKDAVKTVKKQSADQQRAFMHTLSWCIARGYISKKVLQ